jgi:hypothetical protein
MDQFFFQNLFDQGLINEQELQRVEMDAARPISIHWDLKMLLYIGILLLTTGLGITIYKNIDTIGHLAIVIFIAVATLACFTYCFIKSTRFSVAKVTSPNTIFDYVLLTGCLLLLIFIGYIQFQYNVFGNRWGMATFIPMIVLFFCAYYFDHLGVLSMAIVNLAAWFGITVTPLHMLKENDFSSDRIIFTGILLGLLLIVLAIFSIRMKLKPHFAFTYKNFGVHLLCISTIAASVHFGTYYFLFFLALAGITTYLFLQSLKERSFYFLVIATLYFYIGLSYVIINAVVKLGTFGEGQLYLILLYLLGSAIGLIMFLIRYNRIIKSYDSIRG